jgi:phosphoesterase RecJ-like protein
MNVSSSAYDRLLDAVRGSRRVLLTGPEGLDGDSIGACLALALCLRARAPGVHIDVAGVPGARYDWLPGAEGLIADARVKPDYDGVVVLDGDRTRLHPEVASAFAAARWTGIVDHHRSTDVAGYTVHIFDPHSESTCSIVADMARHWGVALDADRALSEPLYCGLIFDTGGFRHSNTRPATHLLAAQLLATGLDSARIHQRVLYERRPAATLLLGQVLAETRFVCGGSVALAPCGQARMQALGAEPSDLEGLVDLLQQTSGVEVSVVLQERGAARTKISMRSAGRVDVAALARTLDPGGGGHAKAAGVTAPWPLAEALSRVEAALGAALG